MDSILVSKELELLWRLSGRAGPGQQAAALESKFQMFRPKILEMMKEMVTLELEQDLPITSLPKSEVAVLLSSVDPRVRMFGLRLLPHATG